MSFTFHSWKDYDRGGDPWRFFLGINGRELERWRVAYTRGAIHLSAEEQVEEEEHLIDWAADRITEAKLMRYTLERYRSPINKIERYKLDQHLGSLGHRKRVLERPGELVVLSWNDPGTGRSIVRSAISEDLQAQEPQRWRVAHTRGAAHLSAEEQVEEEQHLIDWATDRVTEAKLVRYTVERYHSSITKIERHKLDKHVGSLRHRKRVLERQGELFVLSWSDPGTGRSTVRSAISEDLQAHCQNSSMFLDAAGGTLLHDRLERYLLPATSRHLIDMGTLVDDGAGIAIMCGEHDADGSHHFFMTIH